MTTQVGDEPFPFDWMALVPRVLHPLKVASIEALAWIGRPLSPAELHEILGRGPSVSLVSYHVKKLQDLGALETVATRTRRGATETFYYFDARGPR